MASQLKISGGFDSGSNNNPLCVGRLEFPTAGGGYDFLHAVPFAPMVTELGHGRFPGVVRRWVFQKLPEVTSIGMIADPVANASGPFVWVTFPQSAYPEIDIHTRTRAVVGCGRMRATV